MSIDNIRTKLQEALVLLDALEQPTTSSFTFGPSLLEKAATNLVFPSTLSGWSTRNATLSANTNGVQLSETSGTGFHEVYKAITIGSGPYCHSAEVKALTATKGRIWFVNGGTGFFADFDLSAGSISAASNFGNSVPHKSFLVPLADGWFRVGVSGTVSITSGYIDVALRDNAGDTQYAGAGKSMLVRNAQSEAGMFPTSFIPTTNGSATRPKSSHTSIISPIQSTTVLLHARTAPMWPTDYGVLMHIDNNSTDPYNDLEVFQDSTGKLVARVTYDLNTTSDVNLGIVQPNTDFKVALTASAGGLRATLNGGVVQSVAIPNWPNDLTYRRFGTQMQNIRDWNSILYKAEQWFVGMTDAELQQLAG